ncbi:MAG: VWA domain-containing protein [Eubacteriales bacterium]
MNFNSWNFDIGKFNIYLDRPILLLLIVPALILGIIPFFKLHKNRRMVSKHIIPFIIHLLIVSILATMVSGVRITEIDATPTDTNIVVVADMSESNAPMKEKMEEYINSLYEKGSELTDENIEIAVVAFAKGQTKVTDFGGNLDGCLDIDETALDKSVTDIEAALKYANTLFPEKSRQNKRVVILSDGRQTYGNAWNGAQEILGNGARLDAVYFNVADGDNSEVQIVSLSAVNPNVKNGSPVEMEFSIKSTVKTTGKITVYEGEIPVFEEDVEIKKGASTQRFTYIPEGTGVHTVYATLTTSDDSIEQNNTLYSWFNVKGTANMLIVQGDEKQTKRLLPVLEGEDYTVNVISDSQFPEKMQDLLAYDEIVLMNVDFSKMGDVAPTLLKRYVEEVGRGVFVTCGDNSYDYGSGAYVNSPIEEILPVHLEIEDTKETVAVVLVVDLSSSMKQAMGSTTRFEVVKEGAKKCVDALTENDSIGVVVFDQNSKIAVPMTPITEKDWIKQQIDEQFNAYISDSYGTSYMAALKEANSMLSEYKANVKQVVFLSDGAPSDKDGGYDGVIERMAKSGIVTCTVAIGNSKGEWTDELERLSRLGKGSFTIIKDSEGANLPDVLFEIAESAKGTYINDHEVQPEQLNDSTILTGITKLDKLGGYFGTTTKPEATNVISVEDLRPIYAEWKYGNGKVAVFMCDFGGKWTNQLFDDNDGIEGTKLIKNMFKATLNVTVASSGMTFETERTEGETKLTVDVPKILRQGEAVVATVTSPDGETSTYVLDRIAGKKYRTRIQTPDETGTYLINVQVKESVTSEDYIDEVDLASVGYYDEEYNVFDEDGKSLLNDISKVTNGELMADVANFYNIVREDMTEYKHDIQTPIAIIALVLFILDIIFRNFSISFKKKEETMTDEEQIASMRGR